MPLYRRETLKEKLSWVEIDDFEHFTLDFRVADGVREIAPTHKMEYIVLLAGEVAAETAQGRVTLKRKDWMRIPETGAKITTMRTTKMTGSSELLWFAGDWDYTNIVSVFQCRPDKPLEMHYHDCNEYWFIFRGHFRGTYNGKEYDFRPGDMLATGMGVEHAILAPIELLEGVGFSTRLEGKKRFGHLHRHEHGDPVPTRAGY
jgi:mannose-6-phosphate isomerase-like protein (cupin superfamily)